MAVSDAGCGGTEEVWVLITVSDASCGAGERRFFSRQGQTLVVIGRSRGSHGSAIRWFWWGKVGVYMAVLDAGWGVERRGSHGSPRRWLWGVRGQVLMAVPDALCGVV